MGDYHDGKLSKKEKILVTIWTILLILTFIWIGMTK